MLYGQFVIVGAQEEIVEVTVFMIVEIVYGTEDETVIPVAVLAPESDADKV